LTNYKKRGKINNNMIKREILELYNKLKGLGDLKGVKFSYAVAKNISLLEREVKIIQESIKPSPEYSEYQQKRASIAKENSKKDENGKAITFIDENESVNYAIADQSKFDKEIEALQKKYKKSLDERDGQIKEFNELIETDTKIELHKIDIDDVPKDISVKQMEAIQGIIKE